MKHSNWQKFFDGHAPEYMQNVFTGNTEFEIEFIIRELGFVPGNRVLDMGCGTGRHSIPLALRGMQMTGIDLSDGMLKQARDYAKKEKVNVELIRADAVNFSRPGSFDHAICLCEGAMGLLGADEDPGERDLRILENISRSLKPGGKLLMTVLNGLKKIREHSPEDIKEGKFDPVHLVTREKIKINTAEGREEYEGREKGFTPDELYHMLARVGLNILHLWGGTAGSWNKQTLDMDEYEIMLIAEKPLS